MQAGALFENAEYHVKRQYHNCCGVVPREHSYSQWTVMTLQDNLRLLRSF
jgi:hypothetical protein